MVRRSSGSTDLERLVIAALRAAVKEEEWIAADHLLASLEALARGPRKASDLDRAYREVSRLVRSR